MAFTASAFMPSRRGFPLCANCSTGSYDHHADPERLDLLFLPLWFLVPNLAVTALGFAVIFGWAPVAPAMFGVSLAIFHYEWVHYVSHIPYQPRSRIGRWIKQYHLRHHFISEKFWLASHPSMDFCRPHLPAGARGRAQRHDPQALRLSKQGRPLSRPPFVGRRDVLHSA